MTPERLSEITAEYPRLHIVVLGDFCLDRYFEIDPGREEVSIETGLPVHNITNVRCTPGAAGTILNNLVALGIGTILPVGFTGDDGEGWELRRALATAKNVRVDYFVQTDERRTFTYTKPLLIQEDQPPVELSRLDAKNWTPTPVTVEDRLIIGLRRATGAADACVVMDQVSEPGTGVVTPRLRAEIGSIAREQPGLKIIADSRRSLQRFPPAILKMNETELRQMLDFPSPISLEQVQAAARATAQSRGQPVIVTLAERGMVGATPEGTIEHVPAHPVRGPIDIVGAGDAVTANVIAALTAGATMRETLEIASMAASIVIHQLGTTGVASRSDLAIFFTA